MGIPNSTDAFGDVDYNIIGDVDYIIKRLRDRLEDASKSSYFNEQIPELWDHTVDQLLQLDSLEEALPRLSLLYQQIELFA